MGATDDKILLQKLYSGNEEAFNKLYNTYWENLFIYVARIVESEEDAEDIVQETFVTLWKIRSKVLDIQSIKAYLIVMARNQALKHMLNNKNKQAYLDSFAQFAVKYENTIEQAVIANELSSLIDEEISSLPSKMQEIFILSRKEELSYKEIASKLGISDLTVKKQISNSIKQLRLKLGSLYISILILFLQ